MACTIAEPAESPPSDSYAIDLKEPALDLIRPTKAGCRQMEVYLGRPASTSSLRHAYACGTCREPLRMDTLVYAREEMPEFLVALARLTLGDNHPLECVYRGKQRGCSLTLIVPLAADLAAQLAGITERLLSSDAHWLQRCGKRRTLPSSPQPRLGRRDVLAHDPKPKKTPATNG